MGDEEGIENTAEGLRRVTKAAEKAGVTLALEVLNSKVNHKDYHADRTWWAVEVCKRVNSPRVRVLYDIYHMQIMEGELTSTPPVSLDDTIWRTNKNLTTNKVS